MSDPSQRAIADLVFAGFNRHVVAVDRYTGELVWKWKSPQGSGPVSVLLDDDRLIACVNGYLFCLDPLFGQQVWANELKGLGVGAACLASARGNTAIASAATAAVIAQQQAAAAAAAG